MDLVEWKKKGNVWKLESEAFKEPIEIKIWYDNKELAQFNGEMESLGKSIKLLETNLDHEINSSIYKAKQIWDLGDRIKLQDWAISKLNEKIENQNKEIWDLYKVIADLKTTVETLSGTILHLQEQTSLIQKKITKVPMVFHDKWFISWRESSGLWMINVPDGDYLLIAKYIVWEHNEYVTNCDQLMMDTIHVEGQHYIPFYKLEWGTELDTPTATIYYDLVFIPM